MSQDEPHRPGETPWSSTATSRSLLGRLRADDPDAWRRLVDLYAPLVLRWCRRSDLPDHEAADVLQEVFQAVAAHLADFRRLGPGDTFRGWLRTITRNKVHDHFRASRREPRAAGGTEAQLRFAALPAPAPSGDIAGPDPDDDPDLFSRALDMIRGEFEDRTWRAFWQTAVEDRAPRDVAADLEMTPGAVRVAKSRVLRRLREELGDASR
jgi:RNA polymerase sigma-70 factor (ECF subfamily)